MHSRQFSSEKRDTAHQGRLRLLAESISPVRRSSSHQEIAKALLADRQVIVSTAEDGKIAVEKYRDSLPNYYDAVLMDIRMPVMDGYEATEKIRAMGREDARTVPIIAMTADAFADDVQKCFDAGMNGHIAKPIDPEILYKTLSEMLVQ